MAEVDDDREWTELNPSWGEFGDKVDRYLDRANRALGGEVDPRYAALVDGLSGRVLDIGAGTGETLAHFDAVVTALVFCNVDDPATGLAEIQRVLRPDGEFRFLEHVRSRGVRKHLESVVAPVWERTISWCDLRRYTAEDIAASDLELVEATHSTDGWLPPWTMVQGVAVPSDSERAQ